MISITPALGVNLKDYNPHEILDGKKWRISEKIDGVRRLFYKQENGIVIAYSKSGKVDPYLDHINKWFEQSFFPSNMVYDCELVDNDSYFSDVDSFIMRTETNAKASQEYRDNKLDLIALCFDLFDPNGDIRIGSERTKILNDLFFGNLIGEPVLVVPILGYMYGADEESLQELMMLIKKRKGEGLMLMNMDSPYIFGRSKELIKVKRVEDFIGKIITYEIARPDSKIAGGVAALICEIKGCTVPVRVGTGLTNNERYDLATDSIIGKMIEIEGFGYSRDKFGDISINMPVFKQVIV